jgi:NAD(P)H-flavin reductase
MLPRMMQIEHRHQESRDTFTVELAPSGGLRFAPGQFNMVYAPGTGEVPISISGDPSVPEKLVHTIRAVGGVTRQLSRLRVGDAFGVRGPYGTSWPDVAPGGGLVVIAGGIGLAPLRPAIYRALKHLTPLYIVYGARTPAELLYAQQLATWSELRGVRCIITVDRGDPGWHGNSGVVTKYIAELGFDPKTATALVCGPEVMMRFSARELVKLGVKREQIAVSVERNMKCGIGHCGHCQLGPHLLCKTGPVMNYAEAAPLLVIKEL